MKEYIAPEINIISIDNTISLVLCSDGHHHHHHSPEYEDAEAALEDAYTAVKVEEISSNESMSYFSERYWKNIDAKTESLESLKNRRKSLTEDYDKVLEARNKRIEKLKARIAKIS